MTASTWTWMPRSSKRLATCLAPLRMLLGVLATGVALNAAAQQVVNPGDIIVEREITPRDAFVAVPTSQDPVTVRATTFPATSFDPAMATLVSDSDLTNAHGSSGVGGDAALNSTGLQAVTQILSGKSTGNNVALSAGAIGGPAAGIGGTISSSVVGALAPLSSALGGALGGMK
jgi:hypothetical protein